MPSQSNHPDRSGLFDSRDSQHTEKTSVSSQQKTLINYATSAGYLDLIKSTNDSSTELKIVSIGPKEKGFFLGPSGSNSDLQLIRDLYTQWNFSEKQALSWLAYRFRFDPDIDAKNKLELHLNRALMSIPYDSVRFIQNWRYNYFTELLQEYKFFKSTEEGPLFHKKTFYLAHGGLDASQNIQFNNQNSVVVLAINGIHSLGIAYPDDRVHSQHQQDVSIAILKKRIRQLKGEESLDDGSTWEHRPLYITFCGHFTNTLCGHTRSLPLETKIVYNQHKNLDKGILKEEVFEVWRELLSLDEELKQISSRRILIDIRHMSAATRLEFYKKLVRKFNLNSDNSEIPIPIIASHAAYSGIDRLDEMIKSTRGGKDYADLYRNGFLAWNINLTDEDIIEIHRSNGLIGLTLDEFFLGGGYTVWINKLPFKSLQRKRALNLLKRNLEQFIRIPFDYNVSSPLKIWDILHINLNIHEVWQPFERYSGDDRAGLIQDDLRYVLDLIRRESPRFFGDYSTSDLTKKLCFNNQKDFIAKNY